PRSNSASPSPLLERRLRVVDAELDGGARGIRRYGDGAGDEPGCRDAEGGELDLDARGALGGEALVARGGVRLDGELLDLGVIGERSGDLLEHVVRGGRELGAVCGEGDRLEQLDRLVGDAELGRAAVP